MSWPYASLYTGSAGPGDLPLLWPSRNLYGRRLEQPQPNPYAVHWRRDLAGTDARRRRRMATKAAAGTMLVGAALGLGGGLAKAQMDHGDSDDVVSGLGYGILIGLVSAIPVLIGVSLGTKDSTL